MPTDSDKNKQTKNPKEKVALFNQRPRKGTVEQDR